MLTEMKEEKVEIIEIIENFAMLKYLLFTFEGQSGSPCYLQINEDEYNIYGIHVYFSGDYRYATKLTDITKTWLLKFYDDIKLFEEESPEDYPLIVKNYREIINFSI